MLALLVIATCGALDHNKNAVLLFYCLVQEFARYNHHSLVYSCQSICHRLY